MIGTKLAKIRKELGLTQDQLAIELDYSFKERARYISTMEIGVRAVPKRVALIVGILLDAHRESKENG